MMRRKKQKKRITVKARVELERRFLGSIINWYSHGDMRENVAYLRDHLGISWRNFRDKRHRALWRALEVLNIKSIDERMDIIESEIEAEVAEEFKFTPENVKMIEPEERILMGGANPRYANFKDRLIKDSRGLLWLERELEAAGAFPVVGGKIYLRKIAEIGEGEVLRPEHIAELGLFRK